MNDISNVLLAGSKPAVPASEPGLTPAAAPGPAPSVHRALAGRRTCRTAAHAPWLLVLRDPWGHEAD
jgi:hypothetical protein